MKNLRFVFIIIIFLLSLSSCTFFKKIIFNLKNLNNHGTEQFCRVVKTTDTSEIRSTKEDLVRFGFKKHDTVVSIGVGSGWREFMLSMFTDSITFYLEDIDTSCVIYDKIKNKYLPYYEAFRGSRITNSFIPAIGNDTAIYIRSDVANDILIINVYHHFSNDIAIVKECKRILKPGGKLFIDEHVLRRNKYSFKFCDYGGHYKSEKNFVNDILNTGLKCDTIYRYGKYWRIFVFSKQ
jgi:SAM-dependent methyltransferase